MTPSFKIRVTLSYEVWTTTSTVLNVALAMSTLRPKESWSCLYKNGSHWLFCELRPMQLNFAPFARSCTLLNVLPLDAVISPVNCIQSALLALL